MTNVVDAVDSKLRHAELLRLVAADFREVSFFDEVVFDHPAGIVAWLERGGYGATALESPHGASFKVPRDVVGGHVVESTSSPYPLTSGESVRIGRLAASMVPNLIAAQVACRVVAILRSVDWREPFADPAVLHWGPPGSFPGDVSLASFVDRPAVPDDTLDGCPDDEVIRYDRSKVHAVLFGGHGYRDFVEDVEGEGEKKDNFHLLARIELGFVVGGLGATVRQAESVPGDGRFRWL